MTIKAIVETTEGLPEPIAALYEPLGDDRFRLKVEAVDGFALEDVKNLKSALGKERGEADRWRKAAEKYGDLDPDRAREALAKLEEFEQIDPSKEADRIAAAKVEAMSKQLVAKHQSELESRDKRAEHLKTTVEKLLIDQAATMALAEAKGSVKLLLPHVRTRTRVVEQDGSFRVEVLQDDGNPMYNAKGDPASISDLIADMRGSDEFQRAFEASGHSGAGMARPNGTGGGAATSRNQGSWAGARTDRLAAIKTKFPDLPER